MSDENHDSELTIDDGKLETASEETPQAELERLLEEKRLVRKLDHRILPIACLLYLFAWTLFILVTDLVSSSGHRRV
ncbi:hypothetical protein C0989_003585 [Termitomyces sp. Mn162]|nr:hypothetical protein C0989_003585 [Termitomyces sp. Mn162]